MSNRHIALLGKKAKDKITGLTGIITSVSFDLYGCIQAVITPPASKEGKVNSGHWFDVTRLEILEHVSVITLPDFHSGYVADGKKGCAEKPSL